MKRLLLIGGLALALMVPAAWAASLPSNVTGDLTLVSTTATTATVYFQQLTGDPVSVSIESYCYVGPYGGQDSVYAGKETATVTGSGSVTFNIGTRRVKGKTLTPTTCEAQAWVYGPSQTALLLDWLYTLGP